MNAHPATTARRATRVLAGVLSLLCVPVLVATTSAAPAAARPCDPEYFYKTAKLGGTVFDSIGAPAGKYNSSPSTATLSYALISNETVSSTKEAGAEGTVGFAMAQVKASLKISATASVSKGVTVTDTLPVPGHYRGFDQPGVLRQRFNITRWKVLPDCSSKQASNLGNYDLIVGWPYFASCVTKAQSCTPRY